MLFYKFNVTNTDWLVFIMDSNTHQESVITEENTFINFYKKHKTDIWVGFNSRQYDQYVAKAIVSHHDVFKINHWLRRGKQGWQYNSELNRVQLYNFDVKKKHEETLQQLEAFMGHEITINDNTVDQCRYDVQQIIEIFIKRKAEFESVIGLIKEFKLPLKYVSKTKAQLAAIILGANKQSHNDEMAISFVDNKITRNADVVGFYYSNRDYQKTYAKVIAGVKHTFAWGGLHGARDNYHAKGTIINLDVESYYATLMIKYNFGSRNVKDSNKFSELRKQRLFYKHDNDPRQRPYKDVLTSSYGATKDQYNALYDPRQANNVCVNGMLLLLDLIEKLEPYIELIQTNTDGLYVRLLNDNDFDTVDDICYEWEKRTGMSLQFNYYDEVIQKDVNNYIMIDRENNIVKSVGSYVKKLNDLDYDLPIVNKAIIDYFVDNISPADTIYNCDSLREFQRVVNVTDKYDYVNYGHKKIPGLVHRVFASKNYFDGQLFRVRKGQPEKIPYTPDYCFIDDTDITDKTVPDKLNRAWYIELAWKRIREFEGR